MAKNPILDELRDVRERLLAEAGGTVDALVDRLESEQKQSNRPVWRPKHDEQTVAVQRRTGTDSDGTSTSAAH